MTANPMTDPCPIIVAVSKSPTHDFSKRVQDQIVLLAGEGVEGDAHCGRTTEHLYLKRRNPLAPNLTQVHLLAAELLEELGRHGHIVLPGELGENVLTHNLDLLALPTGTRLHCGTEAVVEVTGLRTPCLRIDKFQPGLQQLVWGPSGTGRQRTRRAGIMGVVTSGGAIRAGDAIRLELPRKPHQALGPV